ncbi:MAG: radical SAM family protein [Myxococcaceae bacterium]
MKVLFEQGDDELARVFVAETHDGHRIELVDSTQPPVPRTEKWVLIVSTLVGCPVRCLICDAGGSYEGRLTGEEILEQIDFLVRRRYPDGKVPVPRFKIQFARMGDPAFNSGVLDALIALPKRFDAPGLIPSISTVAPASTQQWFEDLLVVKQRLYGGGRFQMQFSVHSTDELARRRLVPVKCWSFADIAEYGRRFYEPGDKKITLNFAAARGEPLDPKVLLQYFDPGKFVVKLTPINPTLAAAASGLVSLLDPCDLPGAQTVAAGFERAGYQTILSFGEVRENDIGSNCGMYVAGAREGAPRPRRTRNVA